VTESGVFTAALAVVSMIVSHHVEPEIEKDPGVFHRSEERIGYPVADDHGLLRSVAWKVYGVQLIAVGRVDPVLLFLQLVVPDRVEPAFIDLHSVRLFVWNAIRLYDLAGKNKTGQKQKGENRQNDHDKNHISPSID